MFSPSDHRLWCSRWHTSLESPKTGSLTEPSSCLKFEAVKQYRNGLTPPFLNDFMFVQPVYVKK